MVLTSSGLALLLCTIMVSYFGHSGQKHRERGLSYEPDTGPFNFGHQCTYFEDLEKEVSRKNFHILTSA